MVARRSAISRTQPNWLRTHEVTGTIRFSPDARTLGVTFTANGRFLLVTNMGTGAVSVINTATDDVIQSIGMASAPEGLGS